MDGPPQRPDQIPEGAVWIERETEWELGPTDEAGRKHGTFRRWRPDGTLAAETHYDADQPTGVHRRFHPNGDVAREGRFIDGSLHGTVVARASDAPTSEHLQSCCVPENAWQLEIDYDHGQVKIQRWYDRAGIHILPSGRAFPVRPASVPADARFEEDPDAWRTGGYTEASQQHGVWRAWSLDGVLREHQEYDAGRRHGLWQRFLPDGSLLDEQQFRAGARWGTFRQRALPEGRYQDPRVSEERGAFEDNQAVGRWTLHDASGALLHTFDLGIAVTADRLDASPVLAERAGDDDAGDVTTWTALARAMEAEGRLGEAVIALARATAISRDPSPLRALLGRCLPLAEDSAVELGLELVKNADGDLALLVNGFGRGGDAAGLLRTIAASLSRSDRVAGAIADAALCLAPERADCRLTRALLRIHLGDPEGANADAAALPDDWAEQRDFITSYARILFPTFDFGPARQPPETVFPEVPEGIDQSLTAVRDTVQKLATRLGIVRAAIVPLLPDPTHLPAWVPPDLTPLLPDGPVALTSWKYDEIIEDEPALEGNEDPEGDEGEAPERQSADGGARPQPLPTEVTVEERLTVEGSTLPTLMRAARREWTALTWLCWGAGLDHVALPTALSPPTDFGKAFGMSVERHWRCQDKLLTGGLRAMTQNVPGFQWEGISIDALPRVLAEIATDEFREMRALFFWLCDAGLQSLWQDNLRGDA